MCCEYEPVVCPGTARRVARKPHRCSGCWRTIGAGERYQEYTGLFDGAWFRLRRCSHCVAAVEAVETLAREYNELRPPRFAHLYSRWCFCAPYEDFYGDLAEDPHPSHAGRKAWWFLARLVASGRRGWQYRRGPRKGQLREAPRYPGGLVEFPQWTGTVATGVAS